MDNSLNYYYFYIEGTLAIDDKTVYKIHMSPDNESDPGFTGSIFILDKTFNLIKVDLPEPEFPIMATRSRDAFPALDLGPLNDQEMKRMRTIGDHIHLTAKGFF